MEERQVKKKDYSDIEKAEMLLLLRSEFNGDKSKMSKAIGISRHNLIRWEKEYDVIMHRASMMHESGLTLEDRLKNRINGHQAVITEALTKLETDAIKKLQAKVDKMKTRELLDLVSMIQDRWSKLVPKDINPPGATNIQNNFYTVLKDMHREYE